MNFCSASYRKQVILSVIAGIVSASVHIIEKGPVNADSGHVMKNSKLKKTLSDETNGHVEHMNGGVLNGTCQKADKDSKSAGIRDQVSRIPVLVHRSVLFGRKG